jgi:hypothetical protein
VINSLRAVGLSRTKLNNYSGVVGISLIMMKHRAIAKEKPNRPIKMDLSSMVFHVSREGQELLHFWLNSNLPTTPNMMERSSLGMASRLLYDLSISRREN